MVQLRIGTLENFDWIAVYKIENGASITKLIKKIKRRLENV